MKSHFACSLEWQYDQIEIHCIVVVTVPSGFSVRCHETPAWTMLNVVTAICSGQSWHLLCIKTEILHKSFEYMFLIVKKFLSTLIWKETSECKANWSFKVCNVRHLSIYILKFIYLSVCPLFEGKAFDQGHPRFSDFACALSFIVRNYRLNLEKIWQRRKLLEWVWLR